MFSISSESETGELCDACFLFCGLHICYMCTVCTTGLHTMRTALAAARRPPSGLAASRAPSRCLSIFQRTRCNMHNITILVAAPRRA